MSSEAATMSGTQTPPTKSHPRHVRSTPGKRQVQDRWRLQMAAVVAFFFAVGIGFHAFYPILTGHVHHARRILETVGAFLGTFVVVFFAVFSSRVTRKGIELS